MKINQYGRFAIDSIIVKENPDELAEILAAMKAAVVRCEHVFARQRFEYDACSPLFRELHQTEIPPYYDLTLIRDPEAGGLTVEVKERDL